MLVFELQDLPEAALVCKQGNKEQSLVRASSQCFLCDFRHSQSWVIMHTVFAL